MRFVLFSPRIALALSSVLACACSSDDDNNSSGGVDSGLGSGGSGGSSGGNGGGSSGGSGSGAKDAGACDVTVATSDDDVKTLQTALEDVSSGETLCISPGTYHMNRSIALSSANNVTIRGTGATRDDVLLDFTEQSSGDAAIGGAEGILVSTEGLVITNLSIKNTAGNGIKVTGDNATFTNIKVGWDVVDITNGAYAIYPTGIDGVVLEESEAYGAADAGVYAGQCKNVIVRNNVVHDSVLGIEIENTIGAEVYGNEVYDNTCGFLLDLLPGLQQKTSSDYLVHDNKIHDNNLDNFADPLSVAGLMQPGTGIMVLAASDIEIKSNELTNNGGAAITIISYDTVDLVALVAGGTADAPDVDTSGNLLTNRWPERVYVHDNTFTNNGQDPKGDIYPLAAGQADAGGNIPYDVFWDGTLKHQISGDGGLLTMDDAAAEICLGTAEASSFLNFHGAGLIDSTQWTTDPTAHQCTSPPTVSPQVP